MTASSPNIRAAWVRRAGIAAIATAFALIGLVELVGGGAAQGQEGCRDIVAAERLVKACRAQAKLGDCDEARALCEKAVEACSAIPTYREALESVAATCKPLPDKAEPERVGLEARCGPARCEMGLSCKAGRCVVAKDLRATILEYHVNAKALSRHSPCDARDLFERACTMATSAKIDDLFEGIEADLVTSRRSCPSHLGHQCIRSIAPSSPDGMEVVFVPSGAYRRGSDAEGTRLGLEICRKTYTRAEKCDLKWFARESPQKEIDLEAYYVDRYEVSNDQYAMCVEAGGCSAIDYKRCSLFQHATGRWTVGGEPHPSVIKGNHPAVCVTWDEAQAYCTWAGKRLPTEAEWEKAARGTEDARQFPWGNTWSPDWLNWGERTGFGTQDGYETTAPVDAYPPNVSPYGARNMAGNVWEWTLDYHSDAYYEVSPLESPQNTTFASNRVMRGGSWSFAGNGSRTPYRYYANPSARDDGVGFRCVVEAR